VRSEQRNHRVLHPSDPNKLNNRAHPSTAFIFLGLAFIFSGLAGNVIVDWSGNPLSPADPAASAAGAAASADGEKGGSLSHQSCSLSFSLITRALSLSLALLARTLSLSSLARSLSLSLITRALSFSLSHHLRSPSQGSCSRRGWWSPPRSSLRSLHSVSISLGPLGYNFSQHSPTTRPSVEKTAGLLESRWVCTTCLCRFLLVSSVSVVVVAAAVIVALATFGQSSSSSSLLSA